MASFYRGTVWFLTGFFDYTKSGYQRAAKKFTPGALDVDLTGQTFIVTGANSGLGKVTALELAKRGASVHMLCRSKESGEKARQEIEDASKNKNVVVHFVDVSRPKEVKQFADEFVKTASSLHGLVNNAGVLMESRVETPDGYETTFATNTLGTYCMTEFLLPLLKKTPKSRVVNVSSGGMYNVKLDVKDLQFKNGKFDGSIAYSQTKRQQVEMTSYWAKKHSDVLFLSMHPGWASTPGVSKSLPQFDKMMQGKLRTSEEGADTIVYAACSPEALNIKSGSFLQDRKAVSPHLSLGFTQVKEDVVEKLFQECKSMVDEILSRK